MLITREQIIRDLAERTGFWQKSMRTTLSELDKLMKEYYALVTDDEEVVIQMVEGVRLGASIKKPRMRVDPRNQNPVLVKATCKPFARFSDNFRVDIQSNYEDKTSKQNDSEDVE